MLRWCPSEDADMRPSRYVVRTALVNQVRSLTRESWCTQTQSLPVRQRLILLLHPNACSRLPLSAMHRDERNINRHLECSLVTHIKDRDMAATAQNKPTDLTSVPLGLINPELDKTARLFPQTAATLSSDVPALPLHSEGCVFCTREGNGGAGGVQWGKVLCFVVCN